jgi:hypothetical protein
MICFGNYSDVTLGWAYSVRFSAAAPVLFSGIFREPPHAKPGIYPKAGQNSDRQFRPASNTGIPGYPFAGAKVEAARSLWQGHPAAFGTQ